MVTSVMGVCVFCSLPVTLLYKEHYITSALHDITLDLYIIALETDHCVYTLHWL